MERNTPVRKPHSSTADLLTWSEAPPPETPSSASRSAVRSHQPSDGISKVVFGGQVTDEEVESLNRRKPCSEHKMKEITGSGIFSRHEGDGASEPVPVYQQALSGISHISFGEAEELSPKKPISLPEIYDKKFAELSGNDIFKGDATSSSVEKHLSQAKLKEIGGNNIFADGKVESRDYLGGVRKPPGGETSIALV
ncbi:unnamed protein product [Thlaspi arvense]|uniref:DUF4057 domain-containing protein n=1 Tax=Thlaspi arvense TaxID=13288 RepID=A0AAU9SLT5_THLAR|nr:unnamed protein product [Thlaspi arvense]